jgi:hypothetical protein
VECMRGCANPAGRGGAAEGMAQAPQVELLSRMQVQLDTARHHLWQ